MAEIYYTVWHYLRMESSDNGFTWSEARKTDIPNLNTLTALIRLADGRIALIHNAIGGVVGQRDKRAPYPSGSATTKCRAGISRKT